MAYWQSKEAEAAAKGVLKEKQFVDQTTWLTRGEFSHWKGYCREIGYGSISQHRVWTQRWSQDLMIWYYWISQNAHLFSLYTALQKELKQVTAQMALIIQVAPNPDVDVHKQSENSIHNWLNLRTSQRWMIPLHWMVGLLKITEVLLKVLSSLLGHPLLYPIRQFYQKH